MIKIEKIVPGGEALGTDKDGKKIFFWNALPGEIVTDYRVTKNKSHFTFAIANKIENPSPHRIEPKDPCFLSTSPWQIMGYDFELQQKRELVKEIFREHKIEISLPEIITDGKEFYYRNKMEYALYFNKETNLISLAFHMRGSHSKAEITKSSIERPEIFTAALKIVDDLNARKEEARKYQSMLLRCNQEGEVSGGLYENQKPHPVFPTLKDKVLNYEYSYSPNGFFQINLLVYEMALNEIKKHIKTEKVLDLYSGVGTIGLSVARNHDLTLVENNKAAFFELKKNSASGSSERIRSYDEDERATPATAGGGDAPRRRTPNAVLSNSEDALNFITSNQTVILDPPRAGCDVKLINKLLEEKPEKIIYLSCNPATQARDIKFLLEKYSIEDIKTFNFFPRTPHIENLVILSKKP